VILPHKDPTWSSVPGTNSTSGPSIILYQHQHRETPFSVQLYFAYDQNPTHMKKKSCLVCHRMPTGGAWGTAKTKPRKQNQILKTNI